MPLSRHFYSLDEVQAALSFSTTRCNKNETLFWCKEALSSGLISETISCLFESWLWHNGAFRLQWLLDAWDTLASNELTESDIFISAYKLSSIPYLRRDNSLLNTLILIGSNPDKQPDRITPKTPNNAITLFEDIELYFVRAIYQGKGQCAWWSTQFISIERIWEILDWFAENVYIKYTEKYKKYLQVLKIYDALLGYKSLEYDTVINCIAVLSFCISDKDKEESFKEFDTTDFTKDSSSILEELKELEGRKNARKFSVPTMCLYGITKRGCSKWSQQNFVKLNNVEKNIKGCAFWDEALSEFTELGDINDDIKWKSDNDKETFYERYFPDDIPDEWCMAEKIKSHGDGLLGPTEKVNIKKYVKNNFEKLTRLCWNTRSHVLKYLDNYLDGDCNILRIIQRFITTDKKICNDKIKLLPVHKKYIVINKY